MKILFPLLFLLAAVARGPAADRLLILGDSLSKEYEVEGAGIGIDVFPPPSPYPQNWCELLDEHRNNYFEFGNSGTFSDWRLIGHEYNWSIPGSFASEWRDDYLPDAPDDLINQIENGEVQRCVIWLGGNDVRDSYGRLYNGQTAPAVWATDVYGDIAWVLDWVLARRQAGLEVVLVNVVHLGGTPKKNADHPYDVVKTGRVTAALDDLNARLALLAAQKGVGYADVYSMTRELVTKDRWCTGGWISYRKSSSSGDTDALFLGDGFHPNMPAQAVFAQIILDAFNEHYDARIPRLPNREIVSNILGEDPDYTLSQWTVNYGIPSGDRGFADDPDKDGVKNIVEFGLDLDPVRPDNKLLPQPRIISQSGQKYMTLSWQPRDPTNSTECQITPQQTGDLLGWSTIPAASVTSGAFNTKTVRIPLSEGRGFIRLQAKQL